MKSNQAENAICPQCGQAFYCGCVDNKPYDCWCMELTAIDIPTEQQSDECLCPNCIGKLQDQSILNKWQSQFWSDIHDNNKKSSEKDE